MPDIRYLQAGHQRECITPVCPRVTGDSSGTDGWRKFGLTLAMDCRYRFGEWRHSVWNAPSYPPLVLRRSSGRPRRGPSSRAPQNRVFRQLNHDRAALPPLLGGKIQLDRVQDAVPFPFNGGRRARTSTGRRFEASLCCFADLYRFRKGKFTTLLSAKRSQETGVRAIAIGVGFQPDGIAFRIALGAREDRRSTEWRQVVRQQDGDPSLPFQAGQDRIEDAGGWTGRTDGRTRYDKQQSRSPLSPHAGERTRGRFTHSATDPNRRLDLSGARRGAP
jgi:hypothetical protein